MYKGTDIEIDGETYTVPALSLGQLRNGALDLLREHDELIAQSKTYEALALRGKVILAAIRRNYPDFPEDKLFDYLDISNTSPLWLSILGLSGFVAPGETPAAGTEATGTSGPSTVA